MFSIYFFGLPIKYFWPSCVFYVCLLGSIVVYHSLIVSCQTEVQTGLYSSSGRFPGCRRLCPRSLRLCLCIFWLPKSARNYFRCCWKRPTVEVRKAFFSMGKSKRVLHQDNNTIHRPASLRRITTDV